MPAGDGGATETSLSPLYSVVDPDALDPLYSVVDPDALDALFRESGTGGPPPLGRVEFSYEGCRVSVWSDGIVAVEPETADVAAAGAESERADAVEEASD